MAESQPEFVDFEWERATAGYEIRRTAKSFNYFGASDRDREDARLFDPDTEVIEAKTRKVETYNPPPTNTAHRDFATLSNDSSALLEFCNKWGLLKVTSGPESLGSVVEMRKRLRKLLDAVDGANCAKGPKKKRLIDDAITRFAALGKPVLNLILLRDKSRACRIALKIVPRSLFDYMLVQAVNELQGRATYRVCPGCGKNFQVGVGGICRADAATCSDTCRKRKNRHKAKELKDASQG